MTRLLPALAMIGAVALGFMYVSPAYSKAIPSIHEAMARKDSALEKAGEFEKRRNDLQEKRAAASTEDITRIEEFLPDSVDNIQLILDLTALASRSSVQLTKIEVARQAAASVTEGSLSGHIDVNLEIAGTYTAFSGFIKAIEESARLIDVTALRIVASDTGVYTYNLTLRIYWLR
jgi:Tfp pilus assembly protein PilO